MDREKSLGMKSKGWWWWGNNVAVSSTGGQRRVRLNEGDGEEGDGGQGNERDDARSEGIANPLPSLSRSITNF